MGLVRKRRLFIAAASTMAACLMFVSGKWFMWYREAGRLEDELNEYLSRFDCAGKTLSMIAVERVGIALPEYSPSQTPICLDGESLSFSPIDGVHLEGRDGYYFIVFREGVAIWVMVAKPFEEIGCFLSGGRRVDAWDAYLDMYNITPSIVRRAIWDVELRGRARDLLLTLKAKGRRSPLEARLGLRSFDGPGGAVLYTGGEPAVGRIVYVERYLEQSGIWVGAVLDLKRAEPPEGPLPDMEDVVAAMFCIREGQKVAGDSRRKNPKTQDALKRRDESGKE